MAVFERIQPAIVLDADESLSSAISNLSRFKTCVLVTKGGKYAGLIDDHVIRKFPADASSMKVGNAVVPAPVLTPETSLLEACQLFHDNQPLKALPLIARKGNKEEILGVLTLADLLNEISRAELLAKAQVSSVMGTVCTIDEAASISQARSKMFSEKTSKVIVTSKGYFTGVVSTLDLSKLLSKPKERLPQGVKKANWADQPIISLVRENVAKISPNSTLVEASRLMASKNISSLVVLDQKSKPAGLLTAYDILNTLLIKAEETPVEIIGLDSEDKPFYQSILDHAHRVIAKLKRTREVDSVKVRVKKSSRGGSRHRYDIQSRMETPGKSFSVTYSDWDLMGAINGTLGEFKKIFSKSKDVPLHAARRNPMARSRRK